MKLNHIQLADFRNLAAVAVQPHARFNVLAGQNAQGKTNFLEALFLLVCRRSFRGARSTEMIRFGTERASLTAQLEHGGLQREIRITVQRSGRTVRLDGKSHRKAVAWPQGLTAVLFTPDDLAVPKGPPSERRRLLDQAVATIWPAYVDVARDYAKVLHARNKVLREHPGSLNDLLDVYDEQLAALGAKVVCARARCVRALSKQFIVAFMQISQTDHAPGLTYRTQLTLDEGAIESVTDVGRQLGSQLQRRRSEDMARRMTTAGPHHDDLAFEVQGREARHYASQGQVRALVLSFRISQITDTYERFGHYPLLLLDDVSSELDAIRNTKLFEFIQQTSSQVFLTTARPELVPMRENVMHFQVVKGEIQG